MKIPIPDNLKQQLAPYYLPILEPPYYLYRSKKADYDHRLQSASIEQREEAPDHILVLVIDALRHDYEPDIGLDFTTGITPGTWTIPAVTSIHTGKYPHQHRAVTHTGDHVFPEQATVDQTLPEFAESAGYDTYCGCAFYNPFFSVQGWYQTHRVYSDAQASRVVSGYRKWRNGRDNTFAYLHLGDLHERINPPEAYVQRFDVDMCLENIGTTAAYKHNFDEGDPECRQFRDNQLRLYQAALKYIEDTISPLIENLSEDTLIIVAGDHGEAYWEHPSIDHQFSDSGAHCGLGHGGTPFDMVARVPLAVQGENISFDGGWPSLRDIPSTLAKAMAGNSPFGGQPWQDFIEKDRIVFCESVRRGIERKAVYQGNMKVIHAKDDDITLEAKITPSGEEFTQIPEDTKELLVSALPNDQEEENGGVDTSKIVQKRLDALGYT